MDTMEIMKARHSVRQYLNQPMEEEKRKQLNEAIQNINKEQNLHIQIFYEEPSCFESFMAHYGKFEGVRNYICLVGPKSENLEETCGYYGEQLVLLAQSLGLNTCWVAMTHGKSHAVIEKDEKQVCLIALGYGKTQGFPHKSKDVKEVTSVYNTVPPVWFEQGMEAVLLAPTAMNQQKFLFTLDKDTVRAKVNGFGFYAKMDLGIVKYHFEAVTGKKVL